MKILILGANGFIGKNILGHLLSLGHSVTAGVHASKAAYLSIGPKDFVRIDFLGHNTIAHWENIVKPFDAVINCVGILHDKEEIHHKIHFDTPQKIYQACHKTNTHFIHFSALGIQENIPVPYSQSKLAFEMYLKNENGPWLILKPSLIYAQGSYGGTSFFRGLAGLPYFVPVFKGEQKFSPIFMGDLVIVLGKAISIRTAQQTITLVGPEQKSLKEIINLYRAWMGKGPAHFINFPDVFIKPLCWLGNCIPELPINQTTFAMMQNDIVDSPQNIQSVFNVIPKRMEDVLNDHPSAVQDSWHAKLYFFTPILRLLLAFFWMLSGLIGFFSSQTNAISLLLAPLGVNLTLTHLAFNIFCSIDLLLGILLLFAWRTKLIYTLQIGVILLYTLLVSIELPGLWLDPFGSILKNIPLIFLTGIAIILSDQR